MTIYAVSLGAQEPLITELCFGKCGHILIGGLDICGGAFCPCRTAPCPYLDEELDFGKVDVGAGEETLIVRKLKGGS